MSVLRYISISLLVVTLLDQANYPSVLALTEEDMAVNSLTALEIPAEILETPTRSIRQKSTPEPKMMTITELMQEHAAYAVSQKQETNITPINTPNTLIDTLDQRDMFGDFLIESATGGLLRGVQSKRIKLDHMARREQRVSGMRGSVAINMATGTIISGASG